MTVEALSALPDLAIPTTAIGAGVWLFYRLVIRSDRREVGLFRELRRQRDEWRRRAEAAEDLLAECRRDLARVRDERGYGGTPRRRDRRGHGNDS